MESHAQENLFFPRYISALPCGRTGRHPPRDSHLIGYFNYQAEQSCDRKKQLVPVPQTLTCKFAVSECAGTRRQVTVPPTRASTRSSGRTYSYLFLVYTLTRSSPTVLTVENLRKYSINILYIIIMGSWHYILFANDFKINLGEWGAKPQFEPGFYQWWCCPGGGGGNRVGVDASFSQAMKSYIAGLKYFKLQ